MKSLVLKINATQKGRYSYNQDAKDFNHFKLTENISIIEAGALKVENQEQDIEIHHTDTTECSSAFIPTK